MLYFSNSVRAHVNAGTSEVRFEPASGGTYTGLVQLGYLGASPRGDTSKDNVLDKYRGLYSYKPEVSSCVSEAQNKAYLSFDWNVQGADGHPATGDILMVTLPHQVSHQNHSYYSASLAESYNFITLTR